MAAIPIQAPSRYGARDINNSPLPSITSRDEGFGRPFAHSRRPNPFSDGLSPSAASNPMAIRGAEDPFGFAPPPLPPPRIVPISGPIDPAVHEKERLRREEYGGSPLSDSLGMEFSRRRDTHGFPDEGYQSVDTSASSYRSPSYGSPFGFQAMKNFQPTIDSSMLDRLNRPARRSGLSQSANEVPNGAPRANHSQLSQLSLPHRAKPTFLDTGYTDSPPPLSATSPRNPHFTGASTGPFDYRSPLASEPSDMDRSHYRPRRTHSGSVADDYDAREDDIDFPMEETSRMRSLNIEDQWRERDCYQPGQKRRASSPPSDDMPLASDSVRRRDAVGVSRGSPGPRLLVIPQGNPVSSLSPSSRSGSFASSIAGVGSFGRRSPNPLSPGGLSPTDPASCGSPFATPLSLAASPRSSLSRAIAAQSTHGRGLSEQPSVAPPNRALASPRKMAEMLKDPMGMSGAKFSMSSVATKLKGPYMCECCPKKPKKFDTEDELKLHEAEKQYECSFCGNRFKNKNEAERHQNSLHVRRHSWSCSALTGYERAFHESTTRPGEADTCGYCGEEFARNGKSQGAGFISDQDWEERIRHLQDVHKFRECNASKKFYRADHFRQHLKHSHAGTSGKWTNMLENACMMEEDPPVGAR